MQAATHNALDIELLHPLDDPPAFFQRLQRSLLRARTMRGAVAFWTVTPDLVTGSLSELLAAPGSFLCLDLHPPTNIELLVELADRLRAYDPSGRHIYLHLRDVKGPTEVWSANEEMPEHLLHTKTLLFDFDDGTAEIWVGSHNWTRRAIVGPNIEASLVVTVPQKSKLYRQTRRMLERIRKLCERFDPRRAHHYRWLQGGMPTGAILELEGERAGKLEGLELKLFGTRDHDFQQLRTVGRQIFLQVIDTKTRRRYLYRADVTTSSNSPADVQRLAAGLYAGGQRYVVRQGQHLPHLELPPKSRDERPNEAVYCATIAVQVLLPRATRVYDPPAVERWEAVKDDRLLDGLRRYQNPLLVEVSSEYGTAVREVLSKISMRLPARPSSGLAELLDLDEVTLIEEESPLFARKIVEIPAKA